MEPEPPQPPVPPSSRSPRLKIRKQPDRYGALLVIMLIDCTVLFSAGLHGLGRWLPVVLVAFTVTFGIRTSRVEGPVVVASRVVTAAVLVLTIVGAAESSDWIIGIACIVVGVLLITLAICITARVLRHDQVSMQTILGSISVYVLFGLVFAFAEFGVGRVSDQPFFVQVQVPTMSDHLYFSFVTLTTLGYGDLTPATSLGRALVSLEALLGQIFLATLVARLVSLYGKARRAGADA
jgi:Ion channel